MSETMKPILQVFKGGKRRWFSVVGTTVKLPDTSPEIEFFAVTTYAGRPELKRVSREDAAKYVARDEHARVFVLQKSPATFALTVPALIKDGDGNGWDLLLNGRCSITNIHAFLAQYGEDAITPEAPLSPSLLESWLTTALTTPVKDAVSGYSIEDLRERDSLPVRWWESQLNRWLSEAGLEVHVSSVRWESADAERAVAVQAREREMERMLRERELQWRAETREAQLRATYEAEKARIEADRRISESEREHQLQMLELRHRKELLEAEQEIEEARRKSELATLQHELAVARLRKDRETLDHVERRIEEVEKGYASLTAAIENASSVLEKLARLGEPLLQQLTAADPRRAHQAVERLTSPEFGVSPTALALLGYNVLNQTLVERLREKERGDGRLVAITKSDLLTRDIGTAKVKALPIGRSLQFKIESGRAGYLSLLNLGTSGAVFVHVPSALVGRRQVRIESGKAYFVPGPELFPWPWDYREEGPAGWEHIVGIVSDFPLVSPDILERSTPDDPIVRLSSDEVAALFETLQDTPSERWSAGVLSFLVSG